MLNVMLCVYYMLQGDRLHGTITQLFEGIRLSQVTLTAYIQVYMKHTTDTILKYHEVS